MKLSAKTESHSGSCLCGRINFRYELPCLSQGICYCRSCQKASGSSHNPVVVIPKEKFFIDLKDSSCFEQETLRESIVKRYFCKYCGSPIFGEISDVPGIVTLRASLMDNEHTFHPEYLVWTENAMPHESFPEGIAKFQQQAPLEILLGKCQQIIK